MSPPGFGDPRLTSLHEIVVPVPPSWEPQTAGWALVAGLLLAGLIWAILQLRRRWVANRYRLEALLRLARIERRLAIAETRPDALLELPELVKRTALRTWPRAEVASLCGEAWLTFLDTTGPRRDFREDSGRLLIELLYMPPRRLREVSAPRIAKLVSAIRAWIGGHRARA